MGRGHSAQAVLATQCVHSAGNKGILSRLRWHCKPGRRYVSIRAGLVQWVMTVQQWWLA